jgi:hypothetical protein
MMLQAPGDIVSVVKHPGKDQAKYLSLWVISGNGVTPASCPFFPSKQTFVSASGTSAMCHKRTSHFGG